MKLLCKLPKWMGGGHLRMRRFNSFHDMYVGKDKAEFICDRCKHTETRTVSKTAKRAAQ